MGRVSSEQNGTPSTGGNESSESPDRRDPRDMTEGRDFADFLMGSGPLPAESAVPLPGEQEVIATSMRWFAGWCLRFLVIAAAGYILWIGSAKLWAGILPIILSIIVCTVLWPLSRQLRKWHFPNPLAVLTSLLVFFGVFAGIIAAIAPSVVDQAGELVDKGTEGVQKIQDWVAGPPLELQSDQIDNAIDQATNRLQDSTDQITQTAVAGVSAVTSAMVTLVVVLVLTFFFLKDGEKFLPMVRRVTGRHARRLHPHPGHRQFHRRVLHRTGPVHPRSPAGRTTGDHHLLRRLHPHRRCLHRRCAVCPGRSRRQ